MLLTIIAIRKMGEVPPLLTEFLQGKMALKLVKKSSVLDLVCAICVHHNGAVFIPHKT